MRSLRASTCLLLAALLTLPLPAGATLVLSGTTLSPPDLPLARGEDLAVNARIAIIPSGARTFESGHSLQIETDLGDARWGTTVMVNGNPAAQQSGTGSVIFVNGYVLSYPTNRDVALDIAVEGSVPAEAGTSLMVLSVKELDNSGNTVPGSQVTVTEPVAPPVTPLPPTTVATTTLPATPPVSPTPTQAGSGCWLAVVVAAGLLLFALSRKGKR